VRLSGEYGCNSCSFGNIALQEVADAGCVAERDALSLSDEGGNSWVMHRNCRAVFGFESDPLMSIPAGQYLDCFESDPGNRINGPLLTHPLLNFLAKSSVLSSTASNYVVIFFYRFLYTIVRMTPSLQNASIPLYGNRACPGTTPDRVNTGRPSGMAPRKLGRRLLGIGVDCRGQERYASIR
jgi:hypothetical protein